jgi:L-seryl-tRNA(Ser) seleniumtransferase
VKGFTAEADLRDLVNLGTKNGIPIFQDLGAGVLVDLRKYNLPYEPVARESIEIGVDVVTFSGDKVLGGPQAGILIGKRKYIEQIKANPLMRALRCDKLIYSALEPTLRLYFQETKLLKRHYVLRMLMEPIDSLAQRASSLTKKISGHTKTKYQIKVEDTFVQIGSGALPLEELPSKAITIRSTTLTTERLAEYFRKYKTPVLGYIREDKIYFDLRTVFPHEDEELLAALNEILR